MNALRESIRKKYSVLTDAQRKVAEHLLNEPSKSAVEPAAVIAKQAGVSEATVIRFCYAIGYSGFTEVQKELQQELLSGNGGLGEYIQSKREISNSSNFFEEMMERDRENIAYVLRKLETDVLHEVIQTLHATPNVLVVGTLGSYAAAQWFGYYLNLLRGKTWVYKQETENAFLLMDIDVNWAVIVLAFQRYSNESLRVAQMAKQRGAKIIAITDSLLAPISEQADLLIPLEIKQTSTIDTAPPLFSLLNSLLAAYSIKDLDRVKNRMELYDATANDLNLYYKKDRN